MNRLTIFFLVSSLLSALVNSSGTAAEPQWQRINVDPSQVRLKGRDALKQLLVHGQTKEGKWVDLTHAAT